MLEVSAESVEIVAYSAIQVDEFNELLAVPDLLANFPILHLHGQATTGFSDANRQHNLMCDRFLFLLLYNGLRYRASP